MNHNRKQRKIENVIEENDISLLPFEQAYHARKSHYIKRVYFLMVTKEFQELFQ